MSLVTTGNEETKVCSRWYEDLAEQLSEKQNLDIGLPCSILAIRPCGMGVGKARKLTTKSLVSGPR